RHNGGGCLRAGFLRWLGGLRPRRPVRQALEAVGDATTPTGAAGSWRSPPKEVRHGHLDRSPASTTHLRPHTRPPTFALGMALLAPAPGARLAPSAPGGSPRSALRRERAAPLRTLLRRGS